MKKTIFVFVFLLASFTSFAQLKVNNYGKLLIGPFNNSVIDQGNSTVIIGDDPNYVWSDFNMYNMGFQSCKQSETNRELDSLKTEQQQCSAQHDL